MASSGGRISAWGIVVIIFWLCVLFYVLDNPVSSATTIRGWFIAAFTFVTTLVGA